jgi:nucleoside-diphosphate-sugar epimerase
LAQEVIALAQSQSRVVHVGRPADDPARRQPDLSRALTRLGWEPRIARREGLPRTIADFRRRLTAAGRGPVASG